MQLTAKLALLAAALMVCGCVGTTTQQVDCEKMLKAGERDLCIYNKSLRSQESSECKNILNESMRKTCIDEVAINTRNYLPCRQHDKAVYKDDCEAKVSEIRKKVREENPNAKLP